MAHRLLAPISMRTAFLPIALLAILGGRAASADSVGVPGTYPTIQSAIEHAPEGSTIQIDPGHYHERIKISSLDRTLVVRGDPANPANVVIDGDGASDSVISIVDVGSGLEFDGLYVTGGQGGPGVGGGLYVTTSTVVFRNCVFAGNASQDGGGAFILTAGGLFENCVFENNTASRYGGGLMVNIQGTTVFEGCRFVGNRSGMSDPVYGSGGGVHVNDSSPTVVGCTIDGNQGRGSGGGIIVTGHFTEPESFPLLRDVTISNNTLVRQPGDPATEGGGMHIEDNVHAVLQRCHVVGNASHNGGGLNNYRATYVIEDSVIENNHANVENGDGGYGGGIYGQSVNGGPPAQRPAAISVARSVVRNNTGNVGA